MSKVRVMIRSRGSLGERGSQASRQAGKEWQGSSTTRSSRAFATIFTLARCDFFFRGERGVFKVWV